MTNQPSSPSVAAVSKEASKFPGTSIRIIGDVHGKWSAYQKIIKKCGLSLQVGDFGAGFRSRKSGAFYKLPEEAMQKGHHYFIRGNHDNPEVCRQHPLCIGDGRTFSGIFCVGGARSIDRHVRTEGVDWWPDEELSYQEACGVFDRYEEAKPSIVVTHDAPESITDWICVVGGLTKFPEESLTRKLFDQMLEVHKPKLWVHGHWHIDHHCVNDDVEFIGLGELSYVDIDIPLQSASEEAEHG